MDAGGYRGLYDGAWVGTVTALAGGLWLMLGGFYVVRGTVTRDRLTGVGQVLAATPLSRAAYLVGKFLSNLLVLASMAGVLALTAFGLQLARGESYTVDPVALLAPFALFTLPVLAVTSAAAVLFETVRPLRAGPGQHRLVLPVDVPAARQRRRAVRRVRAGGRVDAGVRHRAGAAARRAGSAWA